MYILPFNQDTASHILNLDIMGKLHTLSFSSTHIDTFDHLALSSSNKFTYGPGTEMFWGGCSVLVGNRMLILGGCVHRNQVSVVYPWGIYRIQTLPFIFVNGVCHFNNNTIYLCFDGENEKLCWKRRVFKNDKP